MDLGLSASECPVCFEELGEDRQPYSCPCGHTLCRLCVQHLLRSDATQFLCPLCRFTVDKSSVKLNVALFKLLIQLRSGSLLQSPQALNIDFDDLEMGPMIDRGGFGEVCRATWRENVVAVKVLFSGQFSQEAHDAFKREVVVMNCLRHPNVVLLMGACHTPPRLAIVMEYMAGGSLYSLLHVQKHHLRIEDLVSLASDVCRGLQYLHSINILHRDLKSKNVLLTGPLPCQAKLCDFGMAKMRVESAATTGNIGTVQWTAPEVLNCSRYKFSADVYSFGMVLYELVTGKIPYFNLAPAMVIVSVLMKREQVKVVDPVHPMLGDLVKRCTQWDPQSRPSVGVALSSLGSILPKEPQQVDKQKDVNQSSYLSHTDSLGHVFLSINEDDKELMSLLEGDDFGDGFDSISSNYSEGGLVSKGDLDQFYQKQMLESPSYEEDGYFGVHSSSHQENYVSPPLPVSNVSKVSKQKKKGRKKKIVDDDSESSEDDYLVTQPHYVSKSKVFMQQNQQSKLKKSTRDEPSHKKQMHTKHNNVDDLLLAEALADEDKKQREIADYHLALQMQYKEHNVLVPPDERPPERWLSHAPQAALLSKKSMPFINQLKSASDPSHSYFKKATQPSSPPPPPPPPPLPAPPVPHTRPHLPNIKPMQLLHTQIKKATSRLSRKKLNPVTTVEKRAFPVGNVVGGSSNTGVTHSVNRQIESFNKRWLRHVPSPSIRTSVPLGHVVRGIPVRPIIKRLNSEIKHFNKSHLNQSTMVVYSSLPTQHDILAEKAYISTKAHAEMRPILWRLNSEVRHFDPSKMNLVETVVRNSLPTAEDILAEKKLMMMNSN